MAEWVVLIMIMGVVAVGWILTRRFNHAHELVIIWGVGCLIIVITLIAYILNKVDNTGAGWVNPIQSELEEHH